MCPRAPAAAMGCTEAADEPIFHADPHQLDAGAAQPRIGPRVVPRLKAELVGEELRQRGLPDGIPNSTSCHPA